MTDTVHQPAAGCPFGHDQQADTALPDPVKLYGPEYKSDPYPLYRRMREAGPVHRVEFPSGIHAWLVTGYRAAHATLNDTRLGKNHALGNANWRRLASIMPEPQHSQLQVHLLHQDPPKHTAMRRLVLDAFAPRRVEALRPRLQELADALVDDLLATGGADLVAGFAAHFPFRVLAEVIGLPAELAVRFDRDWGKVVQPVGPLDPGRAAYEGRLRGLQTYIADVVAHKRAHYDPARAEDDLLGRLVAACDAGELSREELDSMVFQLLVAGQEPVTNQITTMLITLLRHPDHLARLRDGTTGDHTDGDRMEDPGLLARAVEELLRHDAAFELTTWRFFAEDSDLFGTTVPAGDSVIVSLCAANRDDEQFPDADRLDFDRTPNAHLAFGHGIHYCPGAALARAELQIAIGTLLSRLPGLRPAGAEAAGLDALTWIPAVLARGVNKLPVAYDRRV
ncbi:cytochrome P450 [Kitasatospora aureofaciens]|uniref:cytochrome P450 family protein n=1 Tax=Kitasatospora aureofaciens TaxID=1894 RepID=UPI001C4836AC|nr:cytochrome P450 [Kitasatospora aureofaciens]MBV6697284.1 cytochrome P450 [Kitasatospora aureofaciens]